MKSHSHILHQWDQSHPSHKLHNILVGDQSHPSHNQQNHEQFKNEACLNAKHVRGLKQNHIDLRPLKYIGLKQTFNLNNAQD